ncbi:MAG: aminotransferase class IV, partial [Myxococcota bacterium]|nr:aminotransferase class IV [Myxococcota bacterium]
LAGTEPHAEEVGAGRAVGQQRPIERQQLAEGITRRSILDIAMTEDLPVSEEPVTPDDLFDAAEAFLTGTSAGVWPIESVDGHAIGGGGGTVPGPISKQLQSRFEAITAGADPTFEHWLTYVDAS